MWGMCYIGQRQGETFPNEKDKGRVIDISGNNWRSFFGEYVSERRAQLTWNI